MSNRQLLALSKLDEFVAWAESQGFQREPIKGTFEALRLRISGRPPLIFFARSTTAAGEATQHATAQHEGTQLVHRFLRAKKAEKNK